MFGLLGAIALMLVEFVARGGNILGPNTWVQIGLVLLAAAAAVAVVLGGARAPWWGAGAAISFAALAALTYASIAWSVQPANSWLEANRTLSYLASFAAALLLARLAPGRWRALIGAVATAATVACGYALLVKVFPGSLDPSDPLGRLQAPFDYWNAVGLMAAMGLPACLWAGARRERAPVLRPLTVPAIAILVAAVVLSLSRGSVLVAVIGLCVWFGLVPLRLRSVVILALGGAGGAVISAWGLAHSGVSGDNVTEAVRTTAGHSFGLVMLVTLVLCTIAGHVARLALDRVAVSASLRRRAAYVLIGLVALIPVGGLVALARSHRGLSGEISHLWQTLTNTNGGASNQPGRLAQLSNSRPHYWSLAIKVGSHHPVAGAGALGFATAQLRYATGPAWKVDLDTATHAHSYVMETFADFGAIGLAISLALFITWAVATARTFEWPGPRRSPPVTRPPPSSDVSIERTGLLALLTIVVTFGVHSLIDWTWFIPGTAVAALACAGWLAGRGPLSRRVGQLSDRRALSRSPAAVGAVVLVVLVALVGLWVIFQPLRSSDDYSSAVTAAIHGDAATALTDARSAVALDPVSIDPLFLLSRLDSDLGNNGAARGQLRRAVSRQPGNPQTWEQLGCFDLAQHRGALAQNELHRALELEPVQTEIQSDPSAFCATLSS